MHLEYQNPVIFFLKKHEYLYIAEIISTHRLARRVRFLEQLLEDLMPKELSTEDG